MPLFAGAEFGVFLEARFQFREQIALRAEMGDVVLAADPGLGGQQIHRLAVIAVIAVAFDEGGVDPQAVEDLLEGYPDIGSAGAR